MKKELKCLLNIWNKMIIAKRKKAIGETKSLTMKRDLEKTIQVIDDTIEKGRRKNKNEEIALSSREN